LNKKNTFALPDKILAWFMALMQLLSSFPSLGHRIPNINGQHKRGRKQRSNTLCSSPSTQFHALAKLAAVALSP